jgi:hypothetical protein
MTTIQNSWKLSVLSIDTTLRIFFALIGIFSSVMECQDVTRELLQNLQNRITSVEQRNGNINSRELSVLILTCSFTCLVSLTSFSKMCTS